eukprot:Skav230991  [mRNA]  locus=scaffold1822:101818:102288:- [translate_table: standard]
MLSSTSIGFIMLIASAGATRIAQDAAEVWNGNADALVNDMVHVASEGATRIAQGAAGVWNKNVDDKHRCVWTPGITGAGYMGKCCTTKCSGKSDAGTSKGIFFNCKVVMGKVSKEYGYSYNCEETCTLSTGDVTTENVTVTRKGGLSFFQSCVSDE